MMILNFQVLFTYVRWFLVQFLLRFSTASLVMLRQHLEIRCVNPLQFQQLVSSGRYSQKFPTYDKKIFNNNPCVHPGLFFMLRYKTALNSVYKISQIFFFLVILCCCKMQLVAVQPAKHTNINSFCFTQPK